MFQILKVLLMKIFKIQSVDLLFLIAFISFYISRYHFSQVFRTSFNIIWKDFHHKFPFSMNSLKHPPHLLNSQIPQSVTKVFCQFSLTYHSFSRLLCYDDARKNQNSPVTYSGSILWCSWLLFLFILWLLTFCQLYK